MNPSAMSAHDCKHQCMYLRVFIFFYECVYLRVNADDADLAVPRASSKGASAKWEAGLVQPCEILSREGGRAGLLLSMEKNRCAANSRMLNTCIVRRLLQKGGMPRVGICLSKIDERGFTLEASTPSLWTALASGGKGQEYKELLPEKYHSFLEQGTDWNLF